MNKLTDNDILNQLMPQEVYPNVVTNGTSLSYNDINSISNKLSDGINSINNELRDSFIIDKDAKVRIGDFEINAGDLGKLLEKFAKEFMPQVLV
jgi:hypothetical protein